MTAMESILYRLKAYFDPFFKYPFTEWRRLERYITIDSIKSKTIVKQSGEKENFLRFILEGAAVMQVKKDEKETCFDLCFENDFITDFESLNRDKVTNIQILTFEPVKVLLINRLHLFRVYESSAFGAQLRRAIAERQNQRNYKNNLGYLGKTTKERYLKLLQERPHLLLRTPQHFVASYLGVTTENLSRIRKKLGRR